ncbi:MAG: PDZ domain-containing protein [Gemmatimonadota bacterium]
MSDIRFPLSAVHDPASAIRHPLSHGEWTGRGSIALSVAFVIAAAALPVEAQQRVEVTTRARAPRAEAGDSTDLQVRRLQRQLDSLTRTITEDGDLTSADRRRVETEIGSALRRLQDLTRTEQQVEAMARVGEMRIRLMPPNADRVSTEMSRALMQVQEAQSALPRGWIGLEVQGAALPPRIVHGEYVIHYMSYPRVISVEPNSPAERAGLTLNDTLIAYDSREVRGNDISLTRLLIPNARLNVRVRRDGKLRDFPVTVAAAPSRVTLRRGDEVQEMSGAWIVAGVPDAPGFPRMAPPTPTAAGGMRAVRTQRPEGAPQPQLPAIAPAAPTPRAGVMFTFSNSGVAGAQLVSITENMGKAIGVASGVFVTAAPPSSPAAESGLLDGDVIVKVNGQTIQTVAHLRGIIGSASENGERSAELEIVRQKKTQRLTLKW